VTVDFSEIDASHIPTIEKNLSSNNIDTTRTQIKHSNLFAEFAGTYHFILSNPPYIDMDLGRTDENVLEHEPYVALSGGLAGLEVIQNIIEEAPKHLERQGQLWIEHEPEQSEAIRNLAREYGFTCTTHTDQYDIERYSVLVLQ
jgi:HemK-like putative methylase